MFISEVIVVSVTTLRGLYSILPPLWTAAITNPPSPQLQQFQLFVSGRCPAVGANPEQDPLHQPGPGGTTLGLVAAAESESTSTRKFPWEKFRSATHYTAEENLHY